MKSLIQWGRRCAPIILIILVACNGDDSSSSSPTELSAPSTIPLVARDGVKMVAEATQQYIDLTPYVDGGEDVHLNEVTLSRSPPQCASAQIEGRGFHTTLSGPGLCEYRYTVANGRERNSGKMVLIAGEGTKAVLPPISGAMAIGQLKSFHLPTALGAALPEGATLDPDASLLGSGDMTVDVAAQTINYTAVTSGLSRIAYRLTGADDSVFIGLIDIAVSNGIDQPPVANQFIHPNLVAPGETITLDVGPHVSDPDENQTVQLVGVHSFYANVGVSDPNALTNTRFTFTTTIPGSHYVAYEVSDQYGGYAISLVKIEVGEKEQWSDIAYQGLLYLAPLTETQAVKKGQEYSAVAIDDDYSPSVMLARMSVDESLAYCAEVGARLATREEWLQLVKQIDIKVMHHWPTKYSYLVNQEGAYEEVWEKQTKAPVDGKGPLCVRQADLVPLLNKSTLKSVANGSDRASVAFQLNLPSASARVEGVTISASLNSEASANLVDSAVETDANGVAIFELDDIKAERVTLAANYGEVTPRVDVRFVGDATTAELRLETRTTSQSSYDSEVPIVATLTDASGNGLEGELVRIFPGTHTDSVLVEPELATDERGEQRAKVTWIDEKPEHDTTVNIMSVYIRNSDAQFLSANTDVHFYGDSEPDLPTTPPTDTGTTPPTDTGTTPPTDTGTTPPTDTGTTPPTDTGTTPPPAACNNIWLNCIDILYIGDGTLFTSSPPVRFYTTMRPIAPPLDVYTEGGVNGPKGFAFLKFNVVEAIKLCNLYNENNIGERTNWRLATKDELKLSLYGKYHNMYQTNYWPSSLYYLSSTPNGYYNFAVSLATGYVVNANQATMGYVSCISSWY